MGKLDIITKRIQQKIISNSKKNKKLQRRSKISQYNNWLTC